MFLRQKGLSTRSIHTMLYGIYHLYKMNDIILNTGKINMFIGEPTLKQTDRPYTHEEIQKILNVSDLRMKVVVGLMASAGLRIGAITGLKFVSREYHELDRKIVEKCDLCECPKCHVQALTRSADN